LARRIARGELWTYEFRAPDKVRPVLVLSRPKAIELLHTVMVAPVSSTIRDIDTEVLVGTHEGLRHPSAVNLDHLHTVEKARLRRFVGTLSEPKMREVCQALAIASGCA